MKKQKTPNKLKINKETLTDLGIVSGGSYLWDTVYHPPKKDTFEGPIVIA